MRRLALGFFLISMTSCTSGDYRLERIDGDRATPLSLKFDSLYGVRDGASVNAEARFADGADVVIMRINLHLGPPAAFRGGTYRAVIGGKTLEGSVECPSLYYLGGQNNQ